MGLPEPSHDEVRWIRAKLHLLPFWSAHIAGHDEVGLELPLRNVGQVRGVCVYAFEVAQHVEVDVAGVY